MSRVWVLGLVLSLTAVIASGCSSRSAGVLLGDASDANESTSAVPATPVSRMSIAASSPVDAYVLLGGRVKTCWFNADAPLLPNHVYRADVSSDGSKVRITIHQKLALGRPGLSTYAIDFRQQGPYTVVSAENRGMPPGLAAKMQFDIARWKRGETNCSKAMPAVAAVPSGAAR